MSVLKFILRIFGWLITILIQVVVSYLIILFFNIIFSGSDNISRIGWLASLLVIWLGYILGINLVGMVALRWVWKDPRLLPTQRLVGSAVGALIPLLILLPIGFSVPVGDTGTSFYDLITNNWQPILAQASLFVAILGFYVPGLVNLPASKTQSTS